MAEENTQEPVILPEVDIEGSLDLLRGWAETYLLNTTTMIEVAALAAVLVAALLVRRLLLTRLEAMLERSTLLRGIRGTLRRLLLVITPATAALLAWIAQSLAIAGGLEGELLRIAANLLTAWVVIRLITGFLRQPGWAALIDAVVWFLTALAILGWFQPFVDLLNSIAFSVGDFRISLMGFINGLLVFIIFLWLSSLLARLVDSRLIHLEGVTPAARVLTGKVLRIVLYMIAFVVALTAVGVNLTALAVFSGALGIGLGFGLQKVVSNLFSGIILLLDRSLKPGDVIEIGDAYGWIRQMGARFATVATRDGKEYLIPNEDLITHQVINWTYSDTAVRIKIRVGISYDSDVHKARELMVEAALAQDRVLRHGKHAPRAHLVDFGDSSVDFELRVWVSDSQKGLVNISSQIRLAIWDLFHEHGVEFPFPQRDVHIVSGAGREPVMSGTGDDQPEGLQAQKKAEP